MSYFVKHKLTIIGIIVGAIGGYAYYHFIGCTTGSCPITSNPVNSIMYGAIMGGILFSAFKKENSDNKKSTK